MLYEYECQAGHVTEHHVKLDGSGTPSSCSALVPAPCDHCDADAEAGEPRPCGLPVKRILSVPSPVFPGAGSWRGA